MWSDSVDERRGIQRPIGCPGRTLMLASLIDGTRAARAPLAYGYGLLLFAYLLDLQHRLFGDDLSPTTQRLVTLHTQIGTGGRVAWWTFAAFTIGTIVDRAFMRPVVDRLMRLPRPVDWERFIARAVRDHKDAEAQYLRADAGKREFQMFRWKSGIEVLELSREVESRERMHAEARFRVELILATLPAAIAIAIEAHVGFVVFGLLALVVDFIAQQDNVRSLVNSSRRERVAINLRELLVAATQAPHPGGGQPVLYKSSNARKLSTVGEVRDAANDLHDQIDADIRSSLPVFKGADQYNPDKFHLAQFDRERDELLALLAQRDRTLSSFRWKQKAEAQPVPGAVGS